MSKYTIFADDVAIDSCDTFELVMFIATRAKSKCKMVSYTDASAVGARNRARRMALFVDGDRAVLPLQTVRGIQVGTCDINDARARHWRIVKGAHGLSEFAVIPDSQMSKLQCEYEAIEAFYEKAKSAFCY